MLKSIDFPKYDKKNFEKKHGKFGFNDNDIDFYVDIDRHYMNLKFLFNSYVSVK